MNQMSTTSDKLNLFSPLKIRGVEFPNRLNIPPMCMYVSDQGFVTDANVCFYGKYAQLGFGSIIQEATGVLPEARISSNDLGIWDDKFIPGLKRITDIAHKYNSVIGIQLAHAGRKASTYRPGSAKGREGIPVSENGWEVVSSTDKPFNSLYCVPHRLSVDEIHERVVAFGDAAARAVKAGYDFIEVHAAHGYLIHEFLSPLCNDRNDNYGGSFENRCRFLYEIVADIRSKIPSTMPIFVRISMTDYVENGWDVPEAKKLCYELIHNHDVDFMDLSTGGLDPRQTFPSNWDHQILLTKEIKKELNIPCSCVSGICDGKYANDIIANEEADLIQVGRAVIRDSFIPRHIAQDLHLPVPSYPEELTWASRIPKHSQY